MIENLEDLRDLIAAATELGTAEARWQAVAATPISLVENCLHPDAEPSAQGSQVIANGVGASPGVASGLVCLNAEEVVNTVESGEIAVLVCVETTPADEMAMRLASGIVTARGGAASHAAVVARGWGIPAVVGVAELQFAENHAVLGENTLMSGAAISLDGGSGAIYGEILVAKPVESTAEMDLILGWADEVRGERIGVRANADRAEEARLARTFGAEGIGLCRTEHLFLGDRLHLVQQFLLARTVDEGEEALEALAEAQREDFANLLNAVAPLPVTVRLLDAPLHEFLGEEVPSEWREHNPMLGTRGVRLAVLSEGLYRMQVQALLAAMEQLRDSGTRLPVSVMVPLVTTSAEMVLVGGWVRDEIATAAHDAEIPVGMMVETPRAALLADEMAVHADFFSFGTNDLTQMVFGLSRDDSGHRLMGEYLSRELFVDDPFTHLDAAAVAPLVAAATRAGRIAHPALEVSVCGEHAGDPTSIQLLVEAGVDYLSCSPYRVPVARLAAAQALIALDG